MTRWEAKTPEELQASADEFEREYGSRDGMSEAQIDKRVAELRKFGRVVKPCDCRMEGHEWKCQGWQSVNKESWEEDQRMRGNL